MKKILTISITILLILIMVLIPKSVHATDSFKSMGYYPNAGVVISIENDIVTFECQNGNQFSFYGAEDWCEGDIVAAIMYDAGTPKVLDDEVIETRYVGWVY